MKFRVTWEENGKPQRRTFWFHLTANEFFSTRSPEWQRAAKTWVLYSNETEWRKTPPAYCASLPFRGL